MSARSNSCRGSFRSGAVGTNVLKIWKASVYSHSMLCFVDQAPRSMVLRRGLGTAAVCFARFPRALPRSTPQLCLSRVGFADAVLSATLTSSPALVLEAHESQRPVLLHGVEASGTGSPGASAGQGGEPSAGVTSPSAPQLLHHAAATADRREVPAPKVLRRQGEARPGFQAGRGTAPAASNEKNKSDSEDSTRPPGSRCRDIASFSGVTGSASE
mmetsp:Transcript_33883/g.100987  ORF Transcript_33883/g.100987 Transcript_33883/m.100987 type:complete len:215 (+) Transcript_33883:1054-1698(+)